MLLSAAILVNINLFNKCRQNFAGFAEKRMVGERSKWRWIFIDFNNNRVALFRPTPQIGRGIDDAGGPNRKEDVSLFCGVDRSFECIGWECFTKPNHVRSQIAAARSTSAIFDIEVITRTIVFETEKAVQISV